MMNIYIDFHVLQTVPPSCVNRDDTGSPKTAVYGGSVRARVSSQSWKHAMREDFKKLFSAEELGSRTKFVTDMIASEMLNIDSSLSEKDCKKKATEALNLAGLKIKEGKDEGSDKADALFFMSCKQAKALAKHALELDLKNDKSAKDILKADIKENPSVDIALFGRMVASDPTLNYDATAQVAHAISTHAVENEYDYFTAVDDCQKDDNAGAGHLGTVEFNSSTLYRYATVNVTELVKILGKENTAEAVKKFGQAFIFSMPAGKVNTFANRTIPDSVYVTIRNDQPVNLCGAFEEPVRRSEKGYAKISEEKLTDYAKNVYNKFAENPEKAFCVGEKLSEIAESMSCNQLLSEIENAVNAKLDEV